jgi:hypothetical protein
MASGLDQDFVASLGNINGYQHRIGGYSIGLVMVGLFRWAVNIRILEKP